MAYWGAFDDAESSFSVVLEDDDRVAYAYLVDRSVDEADPPIVGDVWLYNVDPTPPDLESAFTDAGRGVPPLNASPHVRDVEVTRLEDAAALAVRWETVDHRRYAEVQVDGALCARLCQGSRPGWSRLAASESPLALPL